MRASDLQARIQGSTPGVALDLGAGEHHVNAVIDRPLVLRGRGAATHLMGLPGTAATLHITVPGVVLEDLGVEHLDAQGVAIQADPGTAPRLMNVRVTGGCLVGIDDRNFVTTPQRAPPRATSGPASPAHSAPAPAPAPPRRAAPSPMPAHPAAPVGVGVPPAPSPAIHHAPAPAPNAPPPPQQRPAFASYALAAAIGGLAVGAVVLAGRLGGASSTPPAQTPPTQVPLPSSMAAAMPGPQVGTPSSLERTPPPPPSAPADTFPVIGWAETARDYDRQVGAQITLRCMDDGARGVPVGSTVYATMSSICAAAVHAGVTTRSGGVVTIRIGERLRRFDSTTRHGITSHYSNHRHWTFTFAR